MSTICAKWLHLCKNVTKIPVHNQCPINFNYVNYTYYLLDFLPSLSQFFWWYFFQMMNRKMLPYAIFLYYSFTIHKTWVCIPTINREVHFWSFFSHWPSSVSSLKSLAYFLFHASFHHISLCQENKCFCILIPLPLLKYSSGRWF